MRDLVRLIVWIVADLFRSRAALQVELWMLRQQINVLRRTAPKKRTFSAIDRLIFVCLYRLLPGARDALAIVKPETVVKWHRAGFRLYWRWKSKPRGGRPTVPLEIRKLIREMSIANPLWGAPRSMENSSSSASISDKPAWPSTWSGDETRRPRAGGHSSATTLTGSLRWICSSCRQSRSPALWIADHGAWPATYSVVWCHSASNRRMDRESGHGSMRVGTGSPLSHS